MSPWETEPNFVLFEYRFNLRGFWCAVIRSSPGHLCGYVAVPEWSPWHGTEPEAEVHGGLNYSSAELPTCEVPMYLNEQWLTWWIGFDCGHSADFRPTDTFNLPGTIYRDLNYVKAECRSLAKQIYNAGRF